MTSQLNVDTIVDKAGSGGTNIKVKGSNSTYVSEGGTGTQSLVQGIGKAWYDLDGTGTVALDDSFNCATLTDNGTGAYNIAYTNSMSSANYASLFGGTSQTDTGTTAVATGSHTILVRQGFDSTTIDADPIYSGIFGDLA